MSEMQELAEMIKGALPRVKSGSIRFWGDWFGRPRDNRHYIVGCEAEGECLRLTFNEDEVLSVWSPKGATVDEETFRIEDAERVRWEWFYYGRPKTPENLYYHDFKKKSDGITFSTNVNWYTPQFDPDPSQPAVEIL